MLPILLITVSLFLLPFLTCATPAPLSALPMHPLSFPLLRSLAIRNRNQCLTFCRRRYNLPPCFQLCDQYFPDQSSATDAPTTSAPDDSPATTTTTTTTTAAPATTTDAPTTTTVAASTTQSTTTTAAAPPAAGALTPSCALSFPSHTGVCLTSEERKLARLINDYRESLGLTRVPVSKTLSTVAQAHAFDSQTNNPSVGSCNLHSWSGACSVWTAVCYTSDHAQAEGMWRKPSEMNAEFRGNGYEISAFYSAGETAEMALGQWQGSSGHNAVITEQGGWGPFGSMGVGIFEDYAHVWFADEEDPAGRMTSC